LKQGVFEMVVLPSTGEDWIHSNCRHEDHLARMSGRNVTNIQQISKKRLQFRFQKRTLRTGIGAISSRGAFSKECFSGPPLAGEDWIHSNCWYQESNLPEGPPPGPFAGAKWKAALVPSNLNPIHMVDYGFFIKSQLVPRQLTLRRDHGTP
jgi:hypothetical protein